MCTVSPAFKYLKMALVAVAGRTRFAGRAWAASLPNMERVACRTVSALYIVSIRYFLMHMSLESGMRWLVCALVWLRPEAASEAELQRRLEELAQFRSEVRGCAG